MSVFIKEGFEYGFIRANYYLVPYSLVYFILQKNRNMDQADICISVPNWIFIHFHWCC